MQKVSTIWECDVCPRRVEIRGEDVVLPEGWSKDLAAALGDGRGTVCGMPQTVCDECMQKIRDVVMREVEYLTVAWLTARRSGSREAE